MTCNQLDIVVRGALCEVTERGGCIQAKIAHFLNLVILLAIGKINTDTDNWKNAEYQT